MQYTCSHDLPKELIYCQYYLHDFNFVSEWVKTIEDNLESMRAEEQSFIWPTDTLFRYFRIMEVLLENLRERQEITTSLNESLLQMQDN